MDKADISWLLVSTLLVLMMAVPGLAMFYGGLVRSKNVLSVLLQVLYLRAGPGALVHLRLFLAFTEGNAFFGGLSRAFFSGMFTPADGKYAMSNSLTELLFASFQPPSPASPARWLWAASPNAPASRRCWSSR